MAGLLAALIGSAVPAAAQVARDLAGQTAAPFGVRLENFDLRTSDEKAAVRALVVRRQRHAAAGAHFTSAAPLMLAARESLVAVQPNLLLTDSRETGVPEIVGITHGHFDRLSPPSGAATVSIARSFVESNSWLYGLSPLQMAALETDADYTNPAGNISWVRLKQRINGLPVFRGTLTVALTPRGEVMRTMGQLAAALPAAIPAPDPAMSAAESVAAGAALLDLEVDPGDLVIQDGAKGGTSITFERGPFSLETKVELTYFPLGTGAVELAWSMTLWGEVDAYILVLSAEDGLLLFAKNITEHQTQSASYSVYRNVNSPVDTADSPAPLSPGPNDPTTGTQGAIIARQTVTLIGNEGALSFNNKGWITDGANGVDGHTDGNNVEAGLDLANPDGVDAPVAGVGRVFSTAWNPPPGSPPPGDAPTVAAARDGAVIQMFYVTNRYHDALYELGFTEQALNFQDDNFGRGGAGGDRISAEGQDSSGTNNANFSAPADGSRGRMQMFVFDGSTPDRDGTADADIIIHELTHGTSSRLHGNSSGLTTNMARGLGEGWSDFYAHALLSEPGDPINATYATGGWALLDGFGALGTTNYYYGIRRFPKAVMAHTGGALNRPHNPLTFADLNAGCDTTDGAFPAASGPHISPNCDQFHAAGEIWSSALWEVRALMINRLGFAAGNQRVLQIVTDGMKLSPINPTFIEARDAVLQAATAFSQADVADVWEGFRIRGMGFSAAVIDTSPANVVEAFDPPNVAFGSPVTSTNVTCANPATPPVPGDTVALMVPIANTLSSTVSGVTATLDGSTTVSYGAIAAGTTVTKTFYYTIPPATPCGSLLSLPITGASAVGTLASTAFQLQVGTPTTQTFDFNNTATIQVPASPNTSGPASPYPATMAVSGVPGPLVGATVTLNDVTHSFVDDLDVLLQAPSGETMVVMSDVFGDTNPVAATVTLTDSAAGQAPNSGPLVTGDYLPTNRGASDTFDAPAPGGPYAQPATAGSATLASTFGGIASPNGTWNLWIDDDENDDSGSLATGWSLSLILQGTPSCPACITAYCDPSLDLVGQSVGTDLTVEACQLLTVEDLTVLSPGGEVALTAGQTIVLVDGIVVENGTSLTLGIDPSLLP